MKEISLAMLIELNRYVVKQEMQDERDIASYVDRT